jgi:hypothetical protein
MKISSKGPIATRTRQSLQKASQRQEKKCIFKIRGRICYTCRLKGHLSQNCPNRNKHEPKLVNLASNVHGNSNGLYNSRKVISSPSARVIWVPKFLLTNLKGPMRLGYQNLPKRLQVNWDALRAWLWYSALINFESVKHEGIHEHRNPMASQSTMST